jgi:hypothetical protein
MECQQCGTETRKTLLTPVFSDYKDKTPSYFFCQECVSGISSPCTKCEKRIYHPLTLTIQYGRQHERYCNTCYTKQEKFPCNRCLNTCHKDDKVTLNINNRERLYCRYCFDNHVYFCDDCDMHYEGISCPNCALVLQYSADPPKFFFYGSPEYQYEQDKLYMGTENEIHCKSTAHRAKVITFINKNMNNFLYCKMDGSLSSEKGIEIISHPFTLDYLKRNPENFNGLLNLRKEGCTSYNNNTCGMHVHINRDFFSIIDEYKIFHFFQKEKDFIFNLSQRDRYDFDKWSYSDTKYKPSQLIKNKLGQRHVALNTNSKGTLEIRIFKGTLYPPSFMKNIEFADSMRFVRDVSIQKISKETYIEYLLNNQHNYSNLLLFIHLKIQKLPLKTKELINFNKDLESPQEQPRQIREKGKTNVYNNSQPTR